MRFWVSPHSATPHQQLTTWVEVVPSSATHPGDSNCLAETCFTLSQPPHHPSPLHQHLVLYTLHCCWRCLQQAGNTCVPASLDLVMTFPAHVSHRSTGRTQRKEKLKQTSHDMLIKAGTFRALAVFTDTTLRRTEAALRLQRTLCCWEYERRDAILQFHCLWNCAFRDTFTKWNMLYPHKYWGSL